LISAAFLTAAVAAPAETNVYQAIEVKPFDLAPGVDLPAEYSAALTKELIAQLAGLKKFQSVIGDNAGELPAGVRALRLTGTITRFAKGSRAKRYLIGPGFGKTILKARIAVVDVSTGKVVLEKDVDGKVIMGVAGGDSVGATRGLAKEVAKVARQTFF
jgi:hypothetical protein